MAHAVRAGTQCLNDSSYQPSEIDILINAGVYRDKHIGEPAIAALVQKKLNVNPAFHGRETFAFDVLNGGCGMLNAAHILSTMVAAGRIRIGMAVSSEANPDRDPDPAYRYCRSGAAVLIDVSPDSSKGFGAFAFRNHCEHAGLYSSCVDPREKRGKLRFKQHNGLEEVYLSYAPGILAEVLETEGLLPEELDFIIPSQASPSFVRKLGSVLDMQEHKVLDYSATIEGDTFTTSVFLTLAMALRSGAIRPGQRAALMTFGSGVTVGAAIYHF